MIGSLSLQKRALFNPHQLLGGVLLGLVSGAASGLVAGVLARIAMRGVAVFSGMQPDFSLGGTLFIIGLGAVLGVLPGIVFSFLQPVLPGSVRLKGGLFGLLLSLMIVLPLLLIEPEGELALLPQWITAALFGPIPLIYGLLMGVVAARLMPEAEKPLAGSPRFVRAAGTLTMIGALVGLVVELILGIVHPAILRLGFAATNLLNGVAGGCVILILLVGVIGLLRSGAAGDRGLGLIGLSITLLSFPLLGIVAIFEGMDTMNLHGLIRLMERINAQDSAALLLYPLLFGILGLLLAGIAVLRTRRWSGWRLYIPLFLGLYPLLSITLLHPDFLPSLVSVSFSGRVQLGHWVGAIFFLLWLALGAALRIESSRPGEEQFRAGELQPIVKKS